MNCFCAYPARVTRNAPIGKIIVALFFSLVPAVAGWAVVIDFDSLDASTPPGIVGLPVNNYLATFGISVSGDDLAVFDVRNFVDNGVEFTAPASRNNFLGGSKSPQTNTLTFAGELRQLSFTRNALIVTGPGGTTHPEWSAIAYDSMGNAVDTVGEALIATFANIPHATFTLDGPGIKSVVFQSDAKNFAGYGAVILDDLTLVPEPGTLGLSSILLTSASLCIRWKTKA